MSKLPPDSLVVRLVRRFLWSLAVFVVGAVVFWIIALDVGYRRQAEARRRLEAVSGGACLTEPVKLGFLGRVTGQGQWLETVEVTVNPFFLSTLPAAVPDDASHLLLAFPRLRRLELQGVDVSQQTCRNISQLKTLEFLSLRYTRVGADELRELVKLSKLRELDLWRTELDGLVLSEFAALSNLELLRLWKGPFSSATLRDLRKLPRLKALSLNEVELDEKALEAVGTLEQLERLGLSSCGIESKWVRHLRGLHRLKTLNLQDNWIGDSAISELRQHHSLEVLWVPRTKVTPASIPDFAAMPTLKELVVVGQFEPATLERLKRAVPWCTVDKR